MSSQVKPAGADRQAVPDRSATALRRHWLDVLRRYWLDLLRQWPAVLRRHWLASVLLAAGLILRVLTELAYRPALFYVDTTRYLYNAEQGMDPVGYKGPLRAILAVANFNAVAGFQHLLGLGLAVVIYLLLRRRGVPRWLSALAMAPVLLDGYQLQIEQMIMPDTVFEALIVAGLAILLWRPAVGWRRIAAAGVVLGASATVAQVGEVLVVPAVIYVLALGGGWRQALSKAVALCAAFTLPILAYCAVNYLATGNFFLSDTGVTSLYGRTASAVDCATIRLPADERGLCPTPAQQAEGPDWLEYSTASPVDPYYKKLPRAETNSLVSDFNYRVITQQPLRLLGAYAADVAKLFALTRDGRHGDTPISRWQFQSKVIYYPPWSSEAVVRGEVTTFGGGQPAVWRPVAAFLRSYQLRGGYTPGLLMALLTLTGLAGSAVTARRRADPRTRQLARACLLFFASGVFVTLASDVPEFSWRYQLPTLVTLVPAGMLGIAVIISSARARRSRAEARPA
jgi:hypothetical protein